MKTPTAERPQNPYQFSRAWLGGYDWRLLTAITVMTVVALLVVACGGGGSGVAGVGSGGTGSFSVGTITGFGSVFVNELRYEDSSASVHDDDGLRNRDDLKLGMVVRVQGNTNSKGETSASSIFFDSVLLGPVSAVDTSGKTVTILGQKVVTDVNTVFDASLPSGFNSIQKNQTLEIHGFVNPLTNEVQATLIEAKNQLSFYKISGLLNNLNSSSQTFQIGLETFSYAGLSPSSLPPGLANGLFIKVRTAVTATSGVWSVMRLSGNSETLSDQDDAEVEGLITSLTSSSQFSIGNVPINAASASFPDGAANVVLGARVEVKGRITAGTLFAKEVKLITHTSGKQIDLRGTISNADALAKTFIVRGVTVSYAGSVQFDNGSPSNLINGVAVEVKGQTVSSSSIVNADRIKFPN
jgi:Domain of unknown function (DUF5666)